MDFDPKSKNFSRKSLLDSTSMVMSPIDILKPDYDRFPKFKDVPAMNCTINEGDVLYMPSFWWHEVQSSSSKEQRNLAVNFWYVRKHILTEDTYKYISHSVVHEMFSYMYCYFMNILYRHLQYFHHLLFSLICLF